MSVRIFSAAGALAGGNPRMPAKTAGEGAGGTEKFPSSMRTLHESCKVI